MENVIELLSDSEEEVSDEAVPPAAAVAPIAKTSGVGLQVQFNNYKTHH